MSVRVRVLEREELARCLSDLADLRIQVFAEWPYLYDGTRDYEARYLRTYLESHHAIVVGAFAGERLVGAATGTPMEDHAEGFRSALDGRDLALTDVFYCAESVLLPAYRGLGVGHRFFDLRESRARALGRRYSLFCSVVRPPDHPSRPPDHRSLDAFWRKRGYAKLAGAFAHFAWKDHGEPGESDKPLQVWLKDLRGSGA